MRTLTQIVSIAGLLLSCGWALADPNPISWENWKTDFDQISVPIGEIVSGGPPKDGIPAINEPKFINVLDATTLTAKEPVIGLAINGDARAYPLSVLMWHEIANDVVGGKPVVVTYCPLCNAAIVFDAQFEGKQHDFGTTGRLRNSDLLMYDRQTESWWQQFSGEAIIGQYLGTKLKILPSRLESFENFKKRFPEGKVLVPNNPGLRNYGQNPYSGYDSLESPWLYSGPFPDGIAAMARVIIVRREVDQPIILSMSALKDASKKEIDGFRFSWSEGQNSALDTSRISSGRDVGNIVVVRESGGIDVDVAYDVTFAFVAHAFHPDVTIIK